MGINFQGYESEYKGKWLPPFLSNRLENIRRLVKHLISSKEKIPQVKFFTPHGVAHCQAVEDLIHHLIPGESYLKFSEDERFFLLASAWLHDIGMIRGIMGDEDATFTDEHIRECHHERAEEFIIRNYREVGVEETDKEVFGLLARYHRRRCALTECSEEINIHYKSIRLRLLAAYLRLADALHIDQTRAPDAQYAISLAYDIPNKAKLHWLRSKFVLGIDINTKKKEIIVHLKYPATGHIETREEFNNPVMERTLNSIYDFIVQDLSAELDTVKDVLFAANITYFLRITKKVHKVIFDQQLLRDIKGVFNYYFLLDNPSSSSLYTLMLQSIREILDSHKLNINENREDVEVLLLKEVNSFLDEITERVLGSRKCHTGLRNFVYKIREKVSERDVNRLRDEIRFRIWLLEHKRTGVRFSAYRYFKTKLTEDFWKGCDEPSQIPKSSAGENESPPNSQPSEKTVPISPFNILLYGYSELVIKSLCGFRDAIIARLIGPFCEDIKGANENKHDIYPWTDKLENIEDEPEMLNVFGEINKNKGNNSKENNSKKNNTPAETESYFGKKRSPLLHKFELEQRASKYFRIFVCEGQPKNRTAWGGRTIYHDGTRFTITLANHGFTDIYLIPDAVASSMIAPYKPIEGFPKIHFVMVGANGYDEDKFLHSGGHAMVAAITSFARKHPDWNEAVPPEEKDLPVLILSIITDKFKKSDPPVAESTPKKHDDGESGKSKSKKNNEITVDGWKFRTSFAGEPVRTQVFISQDQEILNSLNNEAPTALFYNPREDQIPISCVDLVITEKAWLEKRIEKINSQKWDGEYISTKNSDSSSDSDREKVENSFQEEKTRNEEEKV